jgi:hypothetical protein
MSLPPMVLFVHFGLQDRRRGPFVLLDRAMAFFDKDRKIGGLAMNCQYRTVVILKKPKNYQYG